jgi:hypothetical protein
MFDFITTFFNDKKRPDSDNQLVLEDEDELSDPTTVPCEGETTQLLDVEYDSIDWLEKNERFYHLLKLLKEELFVKVEYSQFKHFLIHDIDELALQVYSRIRIEIPDLSRIELLVSNIGSIGDLLEYWLEELQCLPLEKGTVELDDNTCELLANCVEDVVTKRLSFVENMFYTLVVLKHTTIADTVGRKIFAQWHALLICYLRLSIVTSNAKTFASFIKQEMKFLPNDVSQAKYMERCVLSVLAALELTTISHGYCESRPTLKLAAKLLNGYWHPGRVLELLDTVSTTPASLYLQGLCWLQLNSQEKVKFLWPKAIGGHPKSSDLHVVVPDGANSTQGYFSHIVDRAMEFSCWSLATHFGCLAIQYNVADDNLLSTTFRCALDDGDYDSAWEIMMCSDFERQQAMTQMLVGELCDAGSIRDLLKFPFVGLSSIVDSTLLFKCRTAAVSVDGATKPYCMAYSWFVYNGDYQNAAGSKYLYALKLISLADVQEFKVTMSEICQSLLSAMTTLSVLDIKDQWVRVPKPRQLWKVTVFKLGFGQRCFRW